MNFPRTESWSRGLRHLRLAALLYTLTYMCVASQQMVSLKMNKLLQSPPDQNRFIQGPEREYYSVNLLVGLNSTLTFPALSDSIVNTWLLTRLSNATYYQQLQSPNQTIQLKPQPLFDVASPSVRNATIRSQFVCTPSDSECTQLSVPTFSIQYVGLYTSLSRSSDYTRDKRVDYNVSAYIDPLKVQCNAPACMYNASMQTLSVTTNTPVQLTCSMIIAQNDVYQPAAYISIWSDSNQECTGATNLTQLPNQVMSIRTRIHVAYLFNSLFIEKGSY